MTNDPIRPAPSSRLALAAVTMTTTNVMKIGLQLALTPTLARILGPADFGVYSLAQPSIMFAMMLADGGLGQSLAREPESNEQVWSSAFWMLLGLGLLLALAVIGWSFPLAMISHESRLPAIVTALSICIILLTLQVSPSARLIRRGKIEAFSLVDLFGNVLGAAVALASALYGAGVWSLVAQFITVNLIRSVGINAMAFRRPKLIFHWDQVAPHSLLGGSIVIAKLTESMGRMLETAVIGGRFGVSQVGLFSFASQSSWSLVQSVNNPAGTMLYAQAVRQKDAEAMRVLHLRVMRTVAIVTLSSTALIAGSAPRLVITLLGEKWSSGELLLELIFLTQAIGTLGQLPSAVLYGLGRTRRQTWAAVIYAALRVGAVSVPVLGLGALPWLLALVNITYFLIGIRIAKVELNWSYGSFVGKLYGPFLAAAVAGLTVSALSSAITLKGLFALMGVLAAGGVVYLFALSAIDWPNVRVDIADLVQFATVRLRGKTS